MAAIVGLVVGVFALSASTGCMFCNAAEVPAVSLTVTDELSACPSTASVLVTHDDEAPETVQCEFEVFEGVCRCRQLIGSEQPGDYVIKVDSADGQRHASAELEVGENSCHVETEEVELTLK